MRGFFRWFSAPVILRFKGRGWRVVVCLELFLKKDCK